MKIEYSDLIESVFCVRLLIINFCICNFLSVPVDQSINLLYTFTEVFLTVKMDGGIF